MDYSKFPLLNNNALPLLTEFLINEEKENGHFRVPN